MVYSFDTLAFRPACGAVRRRICLKLRTEQPYFRVKVPLLRPDWTNSKFKKMIVIAKAIARTTGIEVDVETLKTILMFCAVGLTVSMMCASYGLDLSPGFFWQKNPMADRRAQPLHEDRFDPKVFVNGLKFSLN
jgi:hypothetical protein